MAAGDVVIAWIRHRASSAGVVSDLLLRQSDDGGENWSASGTAPLSIPAFSGELSLVANHAGEWLAAWIGEEYRSAPPRDDTDLYISAAFLPCGNGAIDLGEQCEAPDACCTPNCQLARAGTSCRDVAGDCDVVDLCDGTSSLCPNLVGNSEVICRGASDPCDVEERCDGASPTCPADSVLEDGTECSEPAPCTSSGVCSAGICGPGQQIVCDDGLACTSDACDPISGACVSEPIEGCCLVDADCDDGNDTTTDVCLEASCWHSAPSADGGIGPPLPHDDGCGCRGGLTRAPSGAVIVTIAAALLFRRRRRRSTGSLAR